MAIDVDTLSDEDFDTISDVTLSIVTEHIGMLDIFGDPSKEKLILKYYKDDNRALATSLNPVTESWWSDADAMFSENDDDNSSDDNAENTSEETTLEPYFVESQVISMADPNTPEDKDVVLAACLFKVKKTSNFTPDDLSNMIIQWLPELNDIA